MKRTIAAIVTASLFTTQAWAAATITLQGNYVKIGTSDYGTIGSKSNTPPGMLYDNTGTGTFNSAYDYLTPGTPFEGWTVKFTNTDTSAEVSNTNNNTGAISVTGGTLTDYSGTAYNGTTFDKRSVWEGSTVNYDLLHDVHFNNNQKFIDITTVLTAKVNMTNLYFGRFIDPDARAAAGDSSATNNTLGYSLTDGTVVLTNKQVVMSEALASKYALGLYTALDNAGAGISNGWTTDPANYYNNVNSGNGDYTIGLGFLVPTLASGSTATFSYAYIFGPTRLAANETAVSSGAGGGTAGVIPGCTAPCTISGFDTSGGSGSPTVVSESTSNLVTSLAVAAPAVITLAAPTYAYAQTNTASFDVKHLVVSRVNETTETTTRTSSVTTTTTTNTTPVTTKNWSDGTTTTENGTTVTTSSSATVTTSIAPLVDVSTLTQTASAPIDTFVNLAHVNLFNQDVNLPNPLNRIDLGGATIQKRINGQVKDVGNNSWAWLTGKAGRGNDTRNNTVEIGFEKLVNDTTLVGAQLNVTNTNLTNVEYGSGKVDSYMINAYAVKKLGSWSIRPMVGIDTSNYKTSRTILFSSVENFENAAYTNSLNARSRSFLADLQVIAPKLALVTPYAGVGVRSYSFSNTTESGSALTALDWKMGDNTIVKPYLGARIDSRETDRGVFFSADARVTKFNTKSSTPEGYTRVESKYGDVLVSLDTQVGYKFNPKAQIFAGFQHQQASGYNNDVVSAGVKIDF